MFHALHRLPKPPFPGPLALPLKLIPDRVHCAVLAGILNRLFAPELGEGELDFLDQRILRIQVSDLPLCYGLSLLDRRIRPADPTSFDLSIEGRTYDFLLLATRREDPDTLFFNRRLRLGGDTELGLYLKNFLDALELEDRLGILANILDGATDLVGLVSRSHPG